MTRAVFFDVGNTLLYPFPSVPEVCRQVLEDAGHVRDIAAIDALMPLVDEYYEDRYRDDDSFWTDHDLTAEVWIGMYTLLFRKLGFQQDAENLARRVCDEFGEADRWRAYDDVAPALARLKEAGLRTGVISNWDSRLAGLLAGLGLSGLLDTMVVSADVGLHKPDPRIFHLACERLGVEPQRAVHVGDHHYADIVGATSVGMHAILIDRHGTAAEDTAIDSLDDLESAMRWRG